MCFVLVPADRCGFSRSRSRLFALAASRCRSCLRALCIRTGGRSDGGRSIPVSRECFRRTARTDRGRRAVRSARAIGLMKPRRRVCQTLQKSIFFIGNQANCASPPGEADRHRRAHARHHDGRERRPLEVSDRKSYERLLRTPALAGGLLPFK